MDDQLHRNLLVEYQANVEMWKHDDNVRQQRARNFLTVNTLLIVGIAGVVSFKPGPLYVGAILIIFSIVGVSLNSIWRSVLQRSAEWIRFRRLQLKSIESKLEGMSTFQNTYRAFYDGHETVYFGAEIPKFEISSAAKKRSTLTEGKLPSLMLRFWTIAGIGGVFLMLHAGILFLYNAKMLF